MKSHRIRVPVSTGGRNWLLPFNDMMTLLLTFFVLIISLSTIDSAKVQTASGSLGEALGYVQEKVAARVFDPFILPAGQDEKPGEPLQTEPAKILSAQEKDALAAALNAMEGTRVQTSAGGMTVSLSAGILFRPGSADISPANLPAIEILAPVLARTEAMVRVEGNTSDASHNRRYASPWELSAARAVAVVERLIGKGLQPQRLSAAGYGGLRPALPGTVKMRDSHDNRIDLVIQFS
ncbi:MAG: flagellar motor protein MotB [Syntrophales bacterium]|nr:flagellar motor protein MotB [Syntrophales bacterium]MDD5231818.1 flagellar motor protein MotB [Syntrophales bacterium]MDD5531200.1 flagellar motor protein MotB [Syntrophales bacterium]